MAIQSPVGRFDDRVTQTSRPQLRSVVAAQPMQNAHAPIVIHKLVTSDLWAALSKGASDFGANRTDIVFLCLIYPAVGLILGRLASGYGLLPLLLPLASGFALLGPFAAVGLNEMSRRREMGLDVNLASALAVFRAPAIGSILLLGLFLVGLLGLWLEVSQLLYVALLGTADPTSVTAFARSMFMTGAGLGLIALWGLVGFVFAAIVLCISIVSFPLLLDRNVNINTAIATSLRVVKANPVPIFTWGLIVAGLLVLGSLPLLIGLVIVMPILGHTTWHLYRAAVG